MWRNVNKHKGATSAETHFQYSAKAICKKKFRHMFQKYDGEWEKVIRLMKSLLWVTESKTKRM